MPGRLFHSPARIIKEYLIVYGVGTDPEAGTTDVYGDWPIFRGREPDRPDDLIKCSDTSPRSNGDVQLDGERQEHHGVQLFVRSADYEEGYQKLNDLCMLLDALIKEDVSLSLPAEAGTAGGLYRIAECVRTSGPAPTGPDTPQGKRLTFTANYLVSVRLCG